MDTGSAFAIMTTKQFRSQFGTIVTHLAIVATKEQLSIFDGEGNLIGALDL